MRLAANNRWYTDHNECVAKEKRNAFLPTMNLLGVPQNCLSKLDGFRIMGFGGTTQRIIICIARKVMQAVSNTQPNVHFLHAFTLNR